MTPLAAVVVCTRNRVDLLRTCLRSLAVQSLDRGRFEVVVVDNGSSDDTPAFLAQWQASGPGRRTVVEPETGLSAARNTGLRSTTAPVVLFLDDDAVAPPLWVEMHLAVYEQHPDVVSAGGPVRLVWPHGRPSWAGEVLEHYWSKLDLGAEPGPFPTTHGPYGANMSMRRLDALAAGGFDTALGRRGRRLISSEEADLVARLRDAGGTVWYEPAAPVLHQVTRDRLRRSWILRRAWAQGRSNPRVEQNATPRSRRELLSCAKARARDAVHLARAAAPALLRRPREATTLDQVALLTTYVSLSIEYARMAAP